MFAHHPDAKASSKIHKISAARNAGGQFQTVRKERIGRHVMFWTDMFRDGIRELTPPRKPSTQDVFCLMNGVAFNLAQHFAFTRFVDQVD